MIILINCVCLVVSRQILIVIRLAEFDNISEDQAASVAVRAGSETAEGFHRKQYSLGQSRLCNHVSGIEAFSA
jgi:hypothetical protein